MNDIECVLARKINMPQIKAVVNWAMENGDNKAKLYELTKSEDTRLSVNALWCLSHLPSSESQWLQTKLDELIDRLLVETHPSRKRIFLQLLRRQKYEKESIRTDFLDFCFSKINSECEPYVVRSFCIYCAYEMCRHYEELVRELEEHLHMLSLQPLTPGLTCAVKNTRTKIHKSFPYISHIPR